MEKYKICPSCGARNAPNRIECDQCEADITGVPITQDVAKAIPETKKRFVRICDCGVRNAPQARRCAMCGEDISDIVAVEIAEDTEKGSLTSLDGSYVYALCGQELTIGRSGDMGEYLRGFPFVSRRQAKLSWQNDAPVLANLSQTNPTYVNDQPLAEGQALPLRDGDEIGLGGCAIDGKRQEQAAYFIVRFPSTRED